MNSRGAPDNDKKKDLHPRRRALPYRIERRKVRLPRLSPEEWYYLMAAGNDWENVETAGAGHVEWMREQARLGATDAWKYQEWADALQQLRSKYDVIKVYMSLHGKGLVRAALQKEKGLFPVDRLDPGIITRSPERYWFFTREDLRQALLEISREEGFIPLSSLLKRQGQDVEVMEVIYSE